MSSAALERVQQSRLSVPAMWLLPADKVPAAVSTEGLSSVGWRELRRLAEQARACRPGQVALVTVVTQALAHFPQLSGTDTLGRVRSCLDGGDPHDAYFRVARTGCLPGVGFLRGLVRALAVQADEAVRVEEAVSYGVIQRALVSLWCDAMGVPESDAERRQAAALDQAAAQERPPFRRLAPDPVRRWLRGHQVFAALTQGLIWSFLQLDAAATREDEAETVRALARLRRMFDASAASFRFASDFEPEHYSDTIRPSMREPHVPKGFSGTLSSDHGQLVALMTRLRPLLAQLKTRHPAPYAAMTQALSALYDDHKFVCERFDGAQLGSLRSEGKAGGHTGVEMLERFKTQRLKMVS